MSRAISGYLAAPLFTTAERAFNCELANTLGELMSLYLPQRDGWLLSELLKTGVEVDVARRKVFEADLAAIRAADIVIAVLDGAAVDDGVSFELGYAYARGVLCVGLATDSRRAEGYFKNPMWHGSVRTIFDSTSALTQWLVADGVLALAGGTNDGLAT